MTFQNEWNEMLCRFSRDRGAEQLRQRAARRPWVDSFRLLRANGFYLEFCNPPSGYLSLHNKEPQLQWFITIILISPNRGQVFSQSVAGRLFPPPDTGRGDSTLFTWSLGRRVPDGSPHITCAREGATGRLGLAGSLFLSK